MKRILIAMLLIAFINSMVAPQSPVIMPKPFWVKSDSKYPNNYLRVDYSSLSTSDTLWVKDKGVFKYRLVSSLPSGGTYTAGWGLGLSGTTFFNARHWSDQDSLKTTFTGLIKATSGVLSTVTDNSSNWNTAYGWGNHAGLYEVPLTFSTGLTRATNTITSDISTGKASGQTIYGGTGSGENLTIQSTTHGTKGSIILPAGNKLGIGTTSPAHMMQLFGTDNYFMLSYSATKTTDLNTNSTGSLCINPTLNVGIGSNTPGAKLDVGGSIRSGIPGTDGQFRLYSEQGATDYEYIFDPNTAATQSQTYTLPSAYPAATSYLTSTTAGALSWTTATSGTVTSIATTSPITGGTITSTGTIGINKADAGTDGYLTTTDWNLFYGKLSSVTADAPLSGSGTAGSHLTVSANTAASSGVVSAGAGNAGKVWKVNPAGVPGWLPDSAGGGGYFGAGTVGYLPRWQTTSKVGNSIIFNDTVNDRIGIGLTNPNQKLTINGNLAIPALTGVIYWGTNAGIKLVPTVGNSYLGLHAGEGGAYNGAYNTAVGYYAQWGNNTGVDNTNIGYTSGENNVAGSYNTSLGSNSLNGHTRTGVSFSENTALGYMAGYYVTTASDNVFVGSLAGINDTSGSQNVIIGKGAGYTNTSGSGNVFLGYQAGYSETGSNKLYIDNSNTSSPLILGDFSTDLLTINGTVKITGGSPGAGKILQSDAVGLASWETPGGSTSWTISGVDQYSAVSGNVGINSTSPSQKLDVGGTIKSGVNGAQGKIYLYSEQGATDYIYSITPKTSMGGNIDWVLPPDNGTGGQFLQNGGSGDLIWATPAGGAGTWTSSGSNQYANNSGNVGIGTTNPSAKLQVNGGALQVGLTNHVSIDTVNSLRMAGDATVWEEVFYPAEIFNDHIDDVYDWDSAFYKKTARSDSTNWSYYTFINCNLPHWYKEGSDIRVKIYCSYLDSYESDIKAVIYTRWRNPCEVAPFVHVDCNKTCSSGEAYDPEVFLSDPILKANAEMSGIVTVGFSIYSGREIIFAIYGISLLLEKDAIGSNTPTSKN